MKKNKTKKRGLKESVNFFSVNFDANSILDIHRYLMKGTQYKIILKSLKKWFFILLNSIFNGSNHAKCVSLSNQKCMIQMYDSIDVVRSFNTFNG